MSMQTNCYYGYGVSLSDYPEDSRMKEFILNHRDSVSEFKKGKLLIEYCETHSDDELNYEEDFEDWVSENTEEEGFYGVIADIMYKETGIRFEYRMPFEDQPAAILFPEGYPWNLNKKEKSLTEEKLNKIYMKYIDEIGSELVPEFVRIKYWG